MVLTKFIKNNVVMCVALLGALITSIFVPIDAKYLEYFDFKTLTCLFCVLAVVCALRRIRFFYLLALKIVEHFKTAKIAILVLVYITFIGSMLIANDMALITFLPLGYFVLSSTHKEKYMAFTFIMQNIAANLGGMLTPFGNPQNLYLYTKFSIPTFEFMQIMFPPFIIFICKIRAFRNRRRKSISSHKAYYYLSSFVCVFNSYCIPRNTLLFRFNCNTIGSYNNG